MPYQITPSIQDHFYHVYNRGNNYQNIFFEDKNYVFFLRRLFEKFNKRINVVAYCLMPNHYHLIVKLIESNYLGIAMQKFSISYTKAINLHYGRVGHLFQGRYKAKLIPDNEYLIHLSRYIHLNPIRARLVNKPEDWKYSSYTDFINRNNSTYNLDNDIILEQVEDYAEFVKDFHEDQNYFIKDLLFK